MNDDSEYFCVNQTRHNVSSMKILTAQEENSLVAELEEQVLGRLVGLSDLGRPYETDVDPLVVSPHLMPQMKELRSVPQEGRDLFLEVLLLGQVQPIPLHVAQQLEELAQELAALLGPELVLAVSLQVAVELVLDWLYVAYSETVT
jgi:hypothetical protein